MDHLSFNIANHAHCTPVKCWCPLVCPHCWFFQLQRTDWNNGQSILHLTNTRLYKIYHYDTCQWSRVITGTRTQFKINSLPIKGCYYEEIFTWGVCKWTPLKIELYIQLIIVFFFGHASKRRDILLCTMKRVGHSPIHCGIDDWRPFRPQNFKLD